MMIVKKYLLLLMSSLGADNLHNNEIYVLSKIYVFFFQKIELYFYSI